MRLDKKAIKAICAGLELKDIEKVDASTKDIDEARQMNTPTPPCLVARSAARVRLA